MQLDFTAAGSDWKAYSDLAPDRGEGYLELADFYHRRARAAQEIRAWRWSAIRPRILCAAATTAGLAGVRRGCFR